MMLEGICHDWPVTNVGKLFDIQQGKSLSPKSRAGISPRPFLRTANVFWGKVIITNLDEMDFSDDEVAKFKLKFGDVLVCEGGDIGRTAVWKHLLNECCYQNHLHRLRAKYGNYDSDFLAFWMQAGWNLFKVYGGEGNRTTIPNLSKSRLQTFEIPHPPLPEQRSVATVLTKIQEAIAAQQEIIEQSGELKKALMDKFFTKGLRDEPAKETEVGPIPESWEFSTLGKLCTESGGRIQTGPFGSQLHSHEYEESGLPVINPTHMLGNRINHQNIPKISIETAARLTRHELREGDMLFARRGVIGRHGLVGKNEVGWICGTGCFLVRLNSERIINKFLSFFIATQPVVAWLNANAAGAIMPNLNSQVIGRIPVYFPPKPEQEQIVGLLTGLDDKVDAAEVKKEVLQDLFKTMLHELMTGNIRTTPLMEA
ncbi:MAG: restriction endonuclease subunit S [Deltaproteobacteria bacterium]|nr:restriction endonuclease subunit S [Deltaproteobacteria bacterium]